MDSERVFALVALAFLVLMVAASWKIFSKAGEAGWKSLVPIYGAVVFLRIVGRPWWWLALLLIPIVNIIPSIIICIDLARAFGKGGGFAAGLMLLTPVFLLLLAFGDAQYGGGPKKAVSPPAQPYPRRAA
ncbi:MAG TPA: DUF5684 domain-containing protein [Candidatus Eisenbacteria bacterium]